MHSVGKYDNTEVIARIDRASKIITRLDAETTKQLEDPNMLAETTAVLLRTAVVEYQMAFDGNTLKNMIEYHDGVMFILEVREIMEIIGPALEAKDPVKFAEIKASLEKLYAAWPGPDVPDEVISVTKLQSLVTITELRLSELR
jgi:hypothetical protein